MSTVTVNSELKKESFKLMGIEMKFFIPMTIIVIGAMYLGALPKGMLGAFPLLMILGCIFNEIGNRTPIIKDYFGGGPIVAIFASAALITYRVIPESAEGIIASFMKGEGFLNFYIAALITGSILGMNRNLLIKASLRYLPVIIGGVTCSILLTGVVGSLLGYGFTQAVFYIAVPIMGGGMGAGAVPLAQIFGDAMQKDPAELLSMMVPAVALGNAVAIVMGGLLNKLGKRNKGLSGDGKLLKGEEVKVETEEEFIPLTAEVLGRGLLFATSFFILGSILAKFIALHPYALMILSVAAVKALGLIPREYEQCAAHWFAFIMKNFTPALLVGIGVAYTSLDAVISAFTPIYLILIVTTLVGAVLGSAIIGHFFGFYAIEGAITAGLCMANMGGTGDVAVLSASKRMELMPFAQISSRIGGAFMLILTTFLIRLFL